MPDDVIIIGAGPAGLMAADVISANGIPVALHEAMPSVGRKLLRAGVGGLNLTHSEPIDDFVMRYGVEHARVRDWLTRFGPAAVRDWAGGLGIETFVGSSGRVFPRGMKAAPLVRAWLHRLERQGVHLHLSSRWLRWNDNGTLRFAGKNGEQDVSAACTVFALGGGSWSRLGANGQWLPELVTRGIDCAPLRPANCGFDVIWSKRLRDGFAGQPVKSIAAGIDAPTRRGELMITATGVEGGLIYALGAALRDRIEHDGGVTLQLDLVPDRRASAVQSALQRPRGRTSLANHLRRQLGIEGIKAALLHEIATPAQLTDTTALAALIKSLPLRLVATRPLDEAISSAGGVRLATLDTNLMTNAKGVPPGTFFAGEMLDWEAPTGGYLLTATLASGLVAGQGVVKFLGRQAELTR